MNNSNRIKQNVIIFTIFITICGWIGYFIDKLTGQDYYENIGTVTGKDGSLGLLIWLVSPLISTIILRTFRGDGWKNTGFSLNFKNNKKFYLISILIYPVVTLTVLLLGLITQSIKFSSVNIGIAAYTGVLIIQIASQLEILSYKSASKTKVI